MALISAIISCYDIKSTGNSKKMNKRDYINLKSPAHQRRQVTESKEKLQKVTIFANYI